MPYDITLCDGQHCPLKETCLRYTATIHARQDFFGKPPYEERKQHCQHYWDDRPSEAKIRERAYQLWEEKGGEQGNDVDYWLAAREQLLYQVRNS